MRPKGTARRVNRDQEAVDGLVQLSALAPQIVVMEAAGGYEEPVSDVASCLAGGISAWSYWLWAEPDESKQGAGWADDSRLRRPIG